MKINLKIFLITVAFPIFTATLYTCFYALSNSIIFQKISIEFPIFLRNFLKKNWIRQGIKQAYNASLRIGNATYRDFFFYSSYLFKVDNFFWDNIWNESLQVTCLNLFQCWELFLLSAVWLKKQIECG